MILRSTFAGFNTAKLAMAASQRALDVTGQNISNIHTSGYTRQRLDVASFNMGVGPERYASKYTTKIGDGVLVTGVSQLRDPFLDARFRSEIANVGENDAKAGILEDLADILDEYINDGIEVQFGKLQSMLKDLSEEVGDKEFDNMVKSSSQILADLLNIASKRLDAVKAEQFENFTTVDVPEVNKILENIAELNKTIKSNEILGNKSLELRDQRNQLLDDLATYVKIDVKYDLEDVSNGQEVENLRLSIIDENGGKHIVVYNDRYGQFEAKKFNSDGNEIDPTGNVLDKNGNVIGGDTNNVAESVTLTINTVPSVVSTKDSLTEEALVPDKGVVDITESFKNAATNEAKDAFWNEFKQYVDVDNVLKDIKNAGIDGINTEADLKSALENGASFQIVKTVARDENGDPIQVFDKYKDVIVQETHDDGTGTEYPVFNFNDGTATSKVYLKEGKYYNVGSDAEVDTTTGTLAAAGKQKQTSKGLVFSDADGKNVYYNAGNNEYKYNDGSAYEGDVDDLSPVYETKNVKTYKDKIVNDLAFVPDGATVNPDTGLLEPTAIITNVGKPDFTTVINDALNIIKNIDRYNQLTSANSDITKIQAKIDEYDAKIKELQGDPTATNQADIDGKIKTLQDQLDVLEATTPKSTDDLKNIESLKKQIETANSDLQKYTDLKNETQIELNSLNNELTEVTNWIDSKFGAGTTADPDKLSDIKQTSLEQLNRYVKTKTDGDGNIYLDATPTYPLYKDGEVYQVEQSGINNINIKAPGNTDFTDSLASGSFKACLEMLNCAGDYDAGATNPKGIHYYENLLDTLANKFAEVMNQANKVMKTDENGEIMYEKWPDGTTDANGKVLEGDDLYKLDENGEKIPIYEEKILFVSSQTKEATADGKITAKNISLAEGWLNNEYGLTASQNPKDPVGQNSNILHMINLLNSKHIFSIDKPFVDSNGIETTQDQQIFKGTFQEYFTNIGTVLGLEQSSTETSLENYISVVNEVSDYRDSISGVSLDEEGMTLLQYQKSFTAAARLMTTIDEVLDKLINSTGVAGR